MRKKLLSLLLVFSLLFPTIPVIAEETCNHIWDDWYTEYDATCGEDGEEIRYCTVCNEYETRVIPATNDHDWDEWHVIRSATISRTGKKQRECFWCDTVQTKTISKRKPYVKFSKKTVSLTQSKSKTLKIKYAKGDSVKSWKSSNKKIATVSSKGKVKAKKKGTAKITVTMKSGKKATCTIKVTAKKKGAAVYWTPNGSVYHSTKNCPTLSRSRTIYSGSKSKCPKKRACKVCH